MTTSNEHSGGAEARRQALIEELLVREGLPTAEIRRITPAADQGPALLSHSQLWLWLFEQTFPDQSAYAVPCLIRVHGPVEPDDLTVGLSRVVARHEILRTTFADDAYAEPVQAVQPARDLVVDVHDVSSLPSREGRDSAAAEVVEREIREPFDLARGPLIRMSMIRVEPDEYLVLLTMHHIVADAQSAAILMHELIEAYQDRAALLGADGPIRTPIQYRDFARWQRNHFGAGAALDDLLRFWRGYLRDAPPALEPPADRARTTIPRFRGDVVRADIDDHLIEAARRTARTAGATPFMFWLTVLVALLNRYTGRSDVIVGTPAANRDDTDVASMVGFFVNTLPIRIWVDPADTFGSLLGTVRVQTLDALAHQELPFEKIVEELNPQRSTSAGPYFQIILSYRSAAGAARLGPARVEELPVHNGTSKRDLTVHLVEDGDSLSVTFEYDTDLFDRDRIDRLAAHFLELAISLLEAPDRPIAHAQLMTVTELAELASVSAPDRDLPSADVPLQTMVERSVDAAPDSVAVQCGEIRLTYAELEARANRLAHRLLRSGAGPETMVGLCLHRSADMIVALLGVLKAGAAYVPVDPDDAGNRRLAMMADVGAELLIVTDPDDAAWASGRHEVIVLDPEGSWQHDLPTDRPDQRSGPGNTAYVLFTSGSTGRPKGVAIEHRQTTAYVTAISAVLGIREPLQYAVVQPLAVDSVVTQIGCALTTGGTLHILGRELSLDAARLAGHMQEHGIDLLKLAPSHLQALQQSPHFDGVLPRRHLIIGGETSDWAWISDIQRTAPCTIYNHYGHTETTVGMMVLAIRDNLHLPSTVAPIGPPIPNTRAYVLDQNDQPVPVGIPGELCVGGDTVGRGYHGRPDLTAGAFTPDPFSPVPGARIYRSGDIVRRRPDGMLDFLGRRDDQIKVRGFRVELGEVTAVATHHPKLKDAVTVVQRDPTGDRRLVTYVVPADTDAFESEELRNYLSERLPSHMVPETIVAMPELPLSAHGKVDRTALPVPEPDAAPESAARPELTDLERAVEQVWAGVLQTETVDVSANFFDQGGHSLLVMRVHRDLQDALGAQFDLIELFQHTTVRAQANFLGRHLTPSSGAPTGSENGIPPSEDGHDRGRRQNEQMRRRQQLRRAGRRQYE